MMLMLHCISKPSFRSEPPFHVLEFLQLLVYWTTICGKVYLACHSVREQQALNSEETPSNTIIGSVHPSQTNITTGLVKKMNATGKTSFGCTRYLNQCATIPVDPISVRSPM